MKPLTLVSFSLSCFAYDTSKSGCVGNRLMMMLRCVQSQSEIKLEIAEEHSRRSPRHQDIRHIIASLLLILQSLVPQCIDRRQPATRTSQFNALKDERKYLHLQRIPSVPVNALLRLSSELFDRSRTFRHAEGVIVVCSGTWCRRRGSGSLVVRLDDERFCRMYVEPCRLCSVL